MSRRDFYEVLGIAADADDRQIKRAYRQLAMQHHPDRNPDDPKAEALFKEAAEAYEVLSDKERRQIYDVFGHDGLDGGRYASGAGFSSVEDIFAQFSDIFGDVFGFATSKPEGPQRGRDTRYPLELTFEEAVFGTKKSFTLERVAECVDCDGTGAEIESDLQTCPKCHGSGQVTHREGFFAVSSTCPKCRGRGSVMDTPCVTCKGSGEKRTLREITVRIPAGVDQGTRLRVRGEGEPGTLGGERGDLIVALQVQPSPHFRREGRDLHHTATLSFVRAALGCELEIPTLDGTTTLEIEAGSQHGDVLTLEGLGVQHVSGRSSGDLHVHLELETLSDLTEEQRELLERLAATLESC